ncbi:hypothetical protein [Streptomyces sp. ADI98-10]|uniref:hypothetical protein n=1 Tax=Streptomyces sp. ADI98-10 TaxID=1522763 RepID=UPI000F551E61|nr:hypothetical protein [Streptomyces sp. ADI98-10]RPK77995.1 hypothetical protein EES46_34515 [Streptomyces sp. ADI98-10]
MQERDPASEEPDEPPASDTEAEAAEPEDGQESPAKDDVSPHRGARAVAPPSSPFRIDPLAGYRAALERMSADPLAGYRAALERMSADPLAGYRATLANLQIDPLAGVLHNLAEQARHAYPLALLQQITRLRAAWIPENLRHLPPTHWDWLFRVTVKDGVCLTWAPRTSIVQELLKHRTSKERHQCLLDHRAQVVEDVMVGLDEVIHPDLNAYTRFAKQAASCIRAGQEAAAQALLGNILDSALRVHGGSWFKDQFGSSGDTSHKLIQGSLKHRPGSTFAGGVSKLAPYLLVLSLKNVFDGPHQHQSTFNRNLTAHHTRQDIYRPEFALTSLLVVHGLLRLFDGYLSTEPDPTEEDGPATGSGWTAVLNEVLTVFGALNRTVAQEAFVASLDDAEPEEYREKRALVVNALASFQNKLPPSCISCSGVAVSGTAEARSGKPGTFWWCETCASRVGDRKAL